MNETTPFLSYAVLIQHTRRFIDMLVSMAEQETDREAILPHLTQCTALLSMWGNLVASHGFPSYQKDHEKLATTIVEAVSRFSKR